MFFPKFCLFVFFGLFLKIPSGNFIYLSKVSTRSNILSKSPLKFKIEKKFFFQIYNLTYVQ